MAARRPVAPKAPKPPKAPKVAKAPPPTVEAVAARLLALFPPDEPPALWKEADLKRRLTTAERPVLPAVLSRLQEERQLLALPQGKAALYLFAGPLRGWLAGAATVPEPASVKAMDLSPEHVFAAYSRLTGQSGGFLDVKIAALLAALAPVSPETLSALLVVLWREGRATFSQGDWSLADEATRAAAVELNGEQYLLVRLDEIAN